MYKNRKTMIKKIAHLADIHLRKSPTRNDEYNHVFNNLCKSLKKEKPDRIVIVGDLVHDYLALGTEQSILARNLLLELSTISPVIVTRGNHDFLKSNTNRKDSIEAIINGLATDKIKYFSETDFYDDENITWVVWHHGSKTINPWKTKKGKEILKNKEKTQIYIDLFHDRINNCITSSGYEITGDELFNVGDFKGDYSFLGDIHLKQFLNEDRTKAYCGSLIAQDFGEGDDDFHGYLLWDIIEGNVKEVEVINTQHKYINIYVNEDTNFDNLDFYLDKKIKNISLRINWECLPATRNTFNEQKIKTYVNNQHKNVKIFHKNKFIETDVVKIKQEETIKNVMEQETQHKIFKEYLTKIGVSEDYIENIIKLDNEVYKSINKTDIESYEWDIVKFGGNNFMSYEKFDIDWKDKLGLFQIMGKNTAGKTTLAFKFIPYMLFGKTLETETRTKHGDLRFINNRNGADSTNGYLILEINGEYYGIKKETKISTNKVGEISSVSTKTSYHILKNSNDLLTDENNVDTLDENRQDVVQTRINSVIGSYDNFMRVVLTTSDTLNRVLSSDMSEFTDSLLFDSGLDIFDKKLSIVKKIEKKINDKGRVSCDIDEKNLLIDEYNNKIKESKNKINGIKNDILKNLTEKKNNILTNINTLTLNLNKINDDVYNLDINDIKKSIDLNNKYINENNDSINALLDSNKNLPDTYDSDKLLDLENKKANHKEVEFKLKLSIRDVERDIEKYKNSIEIIKNNIFILKNQGSELKNKVIDLKNNKVCSECGQELTEEHKKHIKIKIDELVQKMYEIKSEIDEKEKVDIKGYDKKIKQAKEKINNLNNKIKLLNDEMEGVLIEFGKLVNIKNDSIKKKQNIININKLRVENDNLFFNNKELKNKIKEYEELILKIEENKELNQKINNLKPELIKIEEDETNYQNSIYEKKIEINNWENKINDLNELIRIYKKQEYRDAVFSHYKKCVHRDGIPKQMLVNHIIPQINNFMNELLVETPFNIWLDDVTLRPKIKYNERPDSVIDCIGASGKERTYSSVVLKFALNQINVKSKPKLFMMDEIMGKLDDVSVEEFVQIMHTIKRYMNRVLVVEHNHNILPDYLIDVFLNNNSLSEAQLIDN